MSFLGIRRIFVPGKTFNPDYPMTRKLLSLLLFLLGLGSASAQMSDNGDGTFTNPVIWADMPDPDVTAGLTLGTVDIPAPSGQYTALPMTLKQPLVSDHRMEVRIWNHDWDQPRMGLVALDKIVFE